MIIFIATCITTLGLLFQGVFADQADMDSFLRIPNIVGFDNSVYSLAIQTNGKIIVGGAFTTYSGTTANRIIRLNSDGTRDTSFDIGNGFNAHVRALAIQADGKIIAGGFFTGYNGSANNYIARLNSDGTKDDSFTIGNGFNTQVRAIAIQPDGKIIVGGAITTYNGSPIYRIVRLNNDGTKDTSFNVGNGFNNNIRAIVIQPDGKIVLGGGFLICSGVVTNRIVRLNSDGTRDTSFTIGSGFNNQINSLRMTTDGKFIVGGSFTTYNGVAANRIARLNSDGTIDSSFDIGGGFNDQVRSIDIQNDGKIMVGGVFTTYSGATANRIIRLNNDGSRDTSSFDIGNGFDAIVNSLIIQNDGKIIIGGDFTVYNGTSLGGYLLRLHGNSYISLLDTDNEDSIHAEFTSKGYILSGNVLSGSAPMVFIDTEGRVPVQLKLKNENILLTLPQDIEIKKSSTMSSYTGVFTPPTFIANSKPETIATIQVGSSTTGLSLSNGLATLSVPVNDAEVGDLVEIFYSEDNGNTWSTQTKTFVDTIDGQAYVSFTTDHFTDFSISTPLAMTGSFTINNDDASTTSSGVTLNISTTPAADQMRFSNDGISWSAREAYATSKSWTLSAGIGTKTVYAEFDVDGDSTGDVSTSDEIEYTNNIVCGGSDCGDIQFDILGSTGYCQYGKTLDFGLFDFSSLARDIFTGFFTTSITGDGGTVAAQPWYCYDSEGDDARYMDIISSDLVNDNNSTIHISSGNVTLFATGGYLFSGGCTVDSGDFTPSASGLTLDNSRVLFGKTSSMSEVCAIGVGKVDLMIHLLANQAVGHYSGTLTLTIPYFDGISN